MDEQDARSRGVELFATILLSVAALATAWSTYQTTRWRGEQASQTSKATADHIESAQASARAGQLEQIDIGTFTQWVNATVARRPALARFYARRFRDEFRPAFAAWAAMHPLTNRGARLTPFALPQYRLADTAQADQLAASAVAATAAASRANRNADQHMLAVVLFGAALFFAGISTKLRLRGLREFLLGLGGAIFVAAAIWVATVPLSM